MAFARELRAVNWNCRRCCSYLNVTDGFGGRLELRLAVGYDSRSSRSRRASSPDAQRLTPDSAAVSTSGRTEGVDSSRRAAAEAGPRIHHRPALRKRIAAPICPLGSITDRMRQRRLGNLALKLRRLSSPVAERASESVNRKSRSGGICQGLRHGGVGHGTTCHPAREDQLAGGLGALRREDRNRARR